MLHRATPANTDDLVRLVGGFRDWWHKSDPSDQLIEATLERLLADGDTAFLLSLDDDGRAVGFAQIRFRLSVWTGHDDCWLEDLFVEDGARGGGHGRALVEVAFELARERGCKRIELDVNEQNAHAIAFYESLGFSTEPKPPGRTLFVSRKL